MSLQNLTEFFNVQLVLFEAIRTLLAVIGCVVTVRAGVIWAYRQIRHNTAKAVSTALLIVAAAYLLTGDAFGATGGAIDGAGAEINAVIMALVIICAVVSLATGGAAVPVLGAIAGAVGLLFILFDCFTGADWLAGLFSREPERTAAVINAETLQTAVQSQARVAEALIAQSQAHAEFMHVLFYGALVAGLVVLWAVAMLWLRSRERRQADQDQGRVIERVVYVHTDQAGRIVPAGRQIAGSRCEVAEVRHDR